MSDTKSRTRELTAALETKTKHLDHLTSNAIKVEDNGGIVVSAEANAEFIKTLGEAQELKTLIEQMGAADELKNFLTLPAGPSAAQDEATAAERARNGRMEGKTLGDWFVGSEEFKSGRGDAKPFIRVQLDAEQLGGQIGWNEQKDVYGGPGGIGGTITIPSLGTVQNIGITEARLRSQHVRDMFPRATTNAAVLYGVRETGFTNNAAVVPVRTSGAFSLKPQTDVAFAPVMYPVATVAHWILAHKNILDDEPRLKDFINRRMVDGIKLAEDRELLYGAGGGEAITGIMNTPGVQTYTGVSSDQLTAQIRRAVTRVMMAEYQPNGIVVHPLDWEELELEETVDGHYRIAVNIAVGGEKRIWGLDIVATTAMQQGDYLLGAFGQGSQLYDREQVNVLASSEDSDNFRRNLITIRAEERLALTVDRPESHVVGSFTPYVKP